MKRKGAPLRSRRKATWMTKRNQQKKKSTLVRVPIGKIMPDRTQVKLSWTTGIRYISPAMVGYFRYLFLGNSISNSDAIGGGTTAPDGYDEYKLLYNNYRVRAFKISVIFIEDDNASANVVPMVAHIWLRNNTTVKTSYADVIGNKDVAFTLIPLIWNGGGPPPSLSMYRISQAIQGTNSKSAEDDDYAAAFGADSSKLWWWEVGVSNQVVAAIDVVAYMIVIIEYYVELFLPKGIDRGSTA